MNDDYESGECFSCGKETEVRWKNLYIIGSEGINICWYCEKKVLNLIETMRRDTMIEKRDTYKKKREERSYTKIVKFTKTGQFGCGPNNEDDVYTIEEFKEVVDSGGFIDYDGFGYPVKNSKANSDIRIKPSTISEIPKDATHIVWYNN